jgi:putative transcriptional regulator
MFEKKLDLNPKSGIQPAKGKLLVAEPFMQDPYFKRSVVLLCDHSPQGSMGFVLNRFIDLKLNELVEGLPAVNARLGIGGPVGSGELFYLHTLGNVIEGSLEVIPGYYTGGEFEQVKDMLALDPSIANRMRFFVGYSGWSEGQLFAEMDQHSWLISDGHPSIIMDTRSTNIWGQTLKMMGQRFAPLANFPEDPSLN